MNILASYNWIKEYVALKESPEAFARRLALSGPAPERLYPQALPYDKMVVGQIKEVKAHPNPKVTKLRVVAADIGEAQPLELVCGGSNLEVGMKVVVALVGAKVKWHGQGDLIELQPAVIQGIESKGMICGANEIGLADAFPHAEREIMDVSWLKAKPGTSLAKALDLDDTVFDIEVTTNRPDAYCMVGLAREASAVLGAKFLWREPVVPSMAKGMTAMELHVKVSASKVCTRYQAVVMTDVTVGPSPWWLKRRLIQSGLRPINTVVDITNYVMLEYGQPLHAFDYDQLAGHSIVVRNAKEGEKILMLDGVERTLKTSNVVICDADKPMAVAGVMGGENSGVHENTKTIVFEAATFDAVSIRRTARSLGVQTDSSLRYEKGLPEDLTAAALARAVELCQEVACGRVASKVFDERSVAHKKVKYSFRPEKAEALIGITIPPKDMKKILVSLGFGVSGAGKKWDVTVPYWREKDIEGERDFTEEIARVYGYANLPSVMPTGEIPTYGFDALLDDEDRAKRFFKGVGCTELINYSLVPAAHLEKCGFKLADAIRIANPLSADFEYLRMSLLPGFLQTIQENQGLFPEGKIFEVSNVYWKKEGDLPDEILAMAGAVYGPYDDDRLFREAKGLFEAYAAEVGVRVAYERMSGGPQHPGRAVKILADGEFVGWIAETHPNVCKKFGVDCRVAAFEVPLAKFLTHRSTHAKYVPIPLFPPAKRDLALLVEEKAEFGGMYEALLTGSALLKDVELFDVYRGKGVEPGKKSLAMHLTFADNERTLTAEEVDAAITSLTGALKEKFGATVRG